MDVQAGMLAQLFERSMGLGPEWEVSDAWLEERDGAPDELHVRVAHVRGRAVECPVCGGVRDLRHPRAHLAPPRHLAARDDRPLRRAQGGLPRRRRAHRAHAAGGPAELPLHRPLRGAGAGHGPVGHDRVGHRVPRAGERRPRVGDPAARGLRGEGGGGLLCRREGRHRRHREEARPELHKHHGGPRR